MNSYVGTHTPADSRDVHVPAYGPVEALLGYVLFYVLVERATPTVVTVVGDALGTAPGTVAFWLAALLWFVLAMTVLDQLRRQLAALGVGSEGDVRRERRRAALTETRALAYLALLVVGSLVVLWTYETGLETAVTMVGIVTTLEFSALLGREFLVMVGFFVAFGVTTHALDRLVVGGVRATLADWRD